MSKKIRNMFLPMQTGRVIGRWKVAAFVLFFLLFTALLASDLFQSKLNVELGEPSTELITAPYEKKIEDLTKYREDQEAAANKIEPVYKADQSQITFLSEDLERTFDVLNDAIDSKADTTEKLDNLRKLVPYSALTDRTLSSLLQLSSNQVDTAEEVATRIILGLARDTNSGARSQSEVPLLQDRMAVQISKSSITDSMKSLMNAYIDLGVIKPTLTIDEEATDKLKNIASSQVTPTYRIYRQNEKIVGPGEIVDSEIYRALQVYGLVELKSPWIPTAGVALLVLLSMAIVILFSHQLSQETYRNWKRLVLIGMLMVASLALGKIFIAINLGDSEINALTAVLIPAAWVTMSVTILLGVRIAIIVGTVLAVLISTMADPNSMGATGTIAGFFALFSGIIGILSVAKLDHRSDLARAGLFIALINAVMVSGVVLILQYSITFWLIGMVLSIGSGFLCSVLTMGILPWLESSFNITSAVRLLELSNPNAPLLKNLLIEAPGTYHHSVVVGNLAETAAEEVAADPVLVRVGALYHDIGKLKRPYFFIENQFSKDNPHDKLAPTLSSLIIISHVKDGLEMAKEHKLPQNIQDIIAQHHGDSTVSFFYHKALEENAEMPEEAFRYDGPRPQTKEAALVLLADNVEAAVRSQKLNNPGKIEGLVRKIIKEKFDEGQLDQCDLTFKDLDKIAVAFTKVLSGIFHSRIEYPEFPSVKLLKELEAVHQEIDSEAEVVAQPLKDE
ncbi:HDIG domain-containing protein [Dehalobacter sp. DCM]|uniref:HD family phosphohydrolase n=1 Tax=Dehalobacter sp. DCM TaxID=2907827 RepID=UPI003082122D|nr:HDIG domain-containing protein [Dehalobacter sp. DCM]